MARRDQYFAVYKLAWRSDGVYIGQTSDLKRRLREHRERWGQPLSVDIVRFTSGVYLARFEEAVQIRLSISRGEALRNSSRSAEYAWALRVSALKCPGCGLHYPTRTPSYWHRGLCVNCCCAGAACKGDLIHFSAADVLDAPLPKFVVHELCPE